MNRTLALVVTLLIAPLAPVRADAAPVDFVRDVRPIFEKRCYECHGPTKQKSGLRLDLKEAAFQGGDNHGCSVVPGRANESPLIQLVTSSDDREVMPPKGGRLSAEEIHVLTRWINEGAVWPDGSDRKTPVDKREHWSFRPLKVPTGENTIDSFIDGKLAEHGLRRSLPADAATWLRRVTFDLIGLPPTPEEVDRFIHQSSESNYAAEADRLLDSPRYGERWAQHWLDVVRYADTHGFEVNTERPHAWPYRDYVIRAFNKDTPYDRFVKEQIVGDALGQDAATGFLVTASVLLPGQIGKDAPSIRLARQDALDEIMNNIGQTFLGLSVGCARCHDHKFDPVSAKDYYAMQAFVAGVEYVDRKLRTPEAEALANEAASLRQQMKEIDRRLSDIVPPAQGLASDEADRLRSDKRSLKAKIESAEAGQLAFAGGFREPDEIRLLSRGDPEQPKEEVFPAVPSALGTVTLPKESAEQDRRRTLAEWIASPQNPLTARVMANRVWQWHFGVGLVETPSDFGRNGIKPTHPELLDWLAAELMRSGWSVKRLHRLIVLSAAYRQSARHDALAATKDADVRLLWRFPARRLEAEAIRDSMLAVSGLLNLQMYGRGFDFFSQRGGLSGFQPIETFRGEGLRRMIYAHKVRRERDVVFGAFDCPDGGQSAARRRESTTPVQALNLFNSRFTLEAAAAFAERVMREAGEEPADQIDRAYRLALGRHASPDEYSDARPVVLEQGLASLCRVLFNSNEFLFVP